eukprot:22690-Amphidinium_carterae.2
MGRLSEGLRDLYSTTWVINPDSNRTLAKWDMLMVLALGTPYCSSPATVQPRQPLTAPSAADPISHY